MTITIEIPGIPVAQGRPRFAVVGGHARAYSPKPASDWRGRAQVIMRDAVKDYGGHPALSHVPLSVEIEAVWPQPKGTAKRERGTRKPRTSKPDADNVGKAVLDAGNGVLWADDAQVAVLIVRKVVGCVGEVPCVKVLVDLAEVRQVLDRVPA